MRFTAIHKINSGVTNLPIRSLFLALAMTSCAAPSLAQTVGNCETPSAEGILDIGNVRATVPVNGNLFFNGVNPVYTVPKDDGVQALFSANLWFGGKVDGDLRVAAALYTGFQFWPGPLDDDGSPPQDCSAFDRIWDLKRSDIEEYVTTGTATTDLIAWPTGLGAPTLSMFNADGNPTESDGLDNDDDGRIDERGEMRSITDLVLALPLSERVHRKINLAAGELPEILGDQMLWWIMNDAGNEHVFSDGTTTTVSDPVGLEVHVSAFAFDATRDLGNTTFYRYRFHYKGAGLLDSAYVGIFSDPDLGAAFDDYVGSDTTLGLGIVYNADDDDDSEYGPAPPAVAFDFLRSPVVQSLGDTAQAMGGVIPDHRSLGMTSFVNFSKGNIRPNGPPRFPLDYYRYMQGTWMDGSPIRVGDDGYNTEAMETTKFSYPGDAAERVFWSEMNIDGLGNRNTPSDKRFVMSSGPFQMEAGDVQELLLGIVWARGQDHLASINEVKSADRRIKNYVDAGLRPPPPPDPPEVSVSEQSRSVILTWTNSPRSNNYLDSYREPAPFGDPDYPFYDLEGYEVWQFDTADARWPGCVEAKLCRLLQVFDRANGITEIRGDDDGDGFLTVYANGTDSGIRHSVSLDGLTNYRTYYFGVRAYAYSRDARPLVPRSPFTRITVVPTRSSLSASSTALAALADSAEFDVVADFAGIGEGLFGASVVDPDAIRDCDYQVVFYTGPTGSTTYDVRCGDETVLDGSQHTGIYGSNIGVFDGLEFSVQNSEEGIRYFTVVSNASGRLDPPDMGAFAFNSSGYPTYDGADRPVAGYQQATSDATWGINTTPLPNPSFATFQSVSLRNDNLDAVGIYDYELRFTAPGGSAWRPLGNGSVMSVPFELWRTGIGTPDDPSDDLRLIPFLCEAACGAGGVENVFDVGGDHSISGGSNDPYSDAISWYLPEDETPGQSGYESFFGGTAGVGHELFARTVLVNWNGGEAAPYNAELPETGTVFRISTSKPLQPGDVFAFSTAGLAPSEPSQSEKLARLDDIGIVPNPYHGTSQYETSSLKDEVRFTNLPDEATIRVFTLNGRLVRTIYKNIPGQEWLSWDLRSDSGRHLASGIYLVHVEVPGVGTQVIKFGYVGKRWGD